MDFGLKSNYFLYVFFFFTEIISKKIFFDILYRKQWILKNSFVLEFRIFPLVRLRLLAFPLQKQL